MIVVRILLDVVAIFISAKAEVGYLIAGGVLEERILAGSGFGDNEFRLSQMVEMYCCGLTLDQTKFHF